MELLYRGTRDGMNSKNFHEKCDEKGPTITLFRNDKGNLFGGYLLFLGKILEDIKMKIDALFLPYQIYIILNQQNLKVKIQEVKYILIWVMVLAFMILGLTMIL